MRKQFLICLVLCFSCLWGVANVGILNDSPKKDPKPTRPRRETPYHSEFGKRVALGVLFGTGMDWLAPKVDSMHNAGVVMNVKYGVPVDVNFTTKNNYYFSLGVFVTHSGGKLKFSTFIEDSLQTNATERKYRAIYLTIPTGIKLKTPSLNNFVIAANFGLYHSFRLSAHYSDKYISHDGTEVKSEKHTYNKGVALFKESAYIGLGLEYVVKNDFRVYFYANYSQGILNFFSPNNSANLVNGSKDRALMNSVEFLIGITF